LALGNDGRRVEAERDVRSVSQETTFEHDVDDLTRLRSTIRRQVEEVIRRCRKSGVVGRTVTLKVRYGDFTTLTRSKTDKTPYVAAVAAARVADLLFDALEVKEGVRLVGVAISNLEPVVERGRQLELFDTPETDQSAVDERRADIEIATDQIRERFGSASIVLGAPTIHRGTQPR
jgi:DNA polymerase-4